MRRSGPTLGARAGMSVIRGYQVAMSGMPSRCRFFPTCSEYTREAIEHFGLLRGTGRGARRIARCHPWNPGGYDPVIDPNVRSVSEG